MNGLYRISASLLSGATITELQRLLDEILASLKSEYEKRLELIARLEGTSTLPQADIDGRLKLVDEFLRDLGGNRGETFEVISYAILREYFRALGFVLQRFSTTHANDGGMDFVAGNAIYQVSINDSTKMLEDDLRKAPG